MVVDVLVVDAAEAVDIGARHSKRGDGLRVAPAGLGKDRRCAPLADNALDGPLAACSVIKVRK